MSLITGTVTVTLDLDVDRDEGNLAVPDTSFGHDALGKLSNAIGLAAENGNFQGVFVIQMHPHGRDRQVVMIVVTLGQAARNLSNMRPL